MVLYLTLFVYACILFIVFLSNWCKLDLHNYEKLIILLYDFTRDGTVVSTLAVSRLLLVFDYMVHLLSGESLHFKKLLQQVRNF